MRLELAHLVPNARPRAPGRQAAARWLEPANYFMFGYRLVVRLPGACGSERDHGVRWPGPSAPGPDVGPSGGCRSGRSGPVWQRAARTVRARARTARASSALNSPSEQRVCSRCGSCSTSVRCSARVGSSHGGHPQASRPGSGSGPGPGGRPGRPLLFRGGATMAGQGDTQHRVGPADGRFGCGVWRPWGCVRPGARAAV